MQAIYIALQMAIAMLRTRKQLKLFKSLEQVHFAKQRVRNSIHLWSSSESLVLLFNKINKASQHSTGQKRKPILGNADDGD